MVIKPKKKVKVSSGTDTKTLTAKAVEKARIQERASANAEIEALETKIAKIEREKLRVQAELDAVTEAKGANGKINVKKLLDRAYSKYADSLKNDETEELRKQVEKLEKTVAKAKLQRLRSRLIEEAGGADVMIVELVKGETEEEISDSIEKAIAAHDRYVGGKKTKSDDDDEEDDDSEEDDSNDDDDSEDDEEDEDEDDDTIKSRKGKGRTAAPEIPSGTGGINKGRKSAASGLLKKVGAMSPTEYREHRTDLMAEISKRYSRGANPLMAKGRR